MCKTSKHVRFVSHYSSQKTIFCLLRGATAEQLPAFWTNTRGHPACAGSHRVTTHCLPPVDIPKYLRGTNRTIWWQVVGDVLLARLTKNLCWDSVQSEQSSREGFVDLDAQIMFDILLLRCVSTCGPSSFSQHYFTVERSMCPSRLARKSPLHTQFQAKGPLILDYVVFHVH